MKMKITKALIRGFKGISEREITFNADSTDIRGFNGSGKSTIATAIYFVLSDCDYQLNNKPMVQPIGNPEVKPYVKLWLDVDGKEITAEKTQKTVVKTDENSGKTTYTTTNTYAINDVPKAYRDFVQYFSEMGIDINSFVILSHPDAFLKDTSAKGREKIREELFKMASNKSDVELARSMPECDEFKALLEKGYKVEEVKAMNQATIKKIDTENGKNNALIDSKIEGLLEAKVTIDEQALKAQKEQLEATHAEKMAQLNNLASTDVAAEISKLRLSRQKLIDDANAELRAKRVDITSQMGTLEIQKRSKMAEVSRCQTSLEGAEISLSRCARRLEELREEYNSEMSKDITYETECPYCGQRLPEDNIAANKQKMADAKAKRLENIKANADGVKKEIEDLNKGKALFVQDAEAAKVELVKIEELSKTLEKQLVEIPVECDPKSIPDAETLQAEINAKEAQLTNSSSDEKERLNNECRALTEQISGIAAELAKADNNKTIDLRVAELRQKKMDDEIAKANAEKVLYQVTEFEKFKNEQLTNDINKHFSLVKWCLYEFQKNGEYKECCYPTFNGKAIDVDTNTALSVAMRLDIAITLQRFNNLFVPIFIDKAESLDAKTRKYIISTTETQIVWLTVDDRDLEVI